MEPAPASPGEAYGEPSAFKLAGFEVVISELETELDYLRRGDAVFGRVKAFGAAFRCEHFALVERYSDV